MTDKKQHKWSDAVLDYDLFDPLDHWVNNPLITPINKVDMYEKNIAWCVAQERKRIIKILQDTAPHLTTSGLMREINGDHE